MNSRDEKPSYSPYREIEEIDPGPERLDALHQLVDEAFKRDLVRVSADDASGTVSIRIHRDGGPAATDLIKLINQIVI